jgi:hypothetical protein
MFTYRWNDRCRHFLVPEGFPVKTMEPPTINTNFQAMFPAYMERYKDTIPLTSLLL